MRPIDADAITYCSYDLDNYHSFRAVDEEEIAEMPTLTLDDLRPHGFWVMVHDVDGNFKGCSCSECGVDDDRARKYCGACGARMDKRIGR